MGTMSNKIKQIFLVGIIISLVAFFYIYKLGSIPNGIYVDEAAVVYNAYSIFETGKDIFAQPYPVLFRLLGSYTPPLFIYISVGFIKFLGMEPYVFRLISAISALVSVLFFYLFVKKLNIFKSDKSYFIITFFYSISPWLVFNSRLGYEVTLAYTLFNIGVYFLLIALDKPKNYILAIVFLSLSTYTAHTQRFLVPIFCIFYIIFFARNVIKKENIRYLLIAFVIILIIHIPHLSVINTPAFWVKNERLLDSGGSRIVKNIFNQTFSNLSTKNLFYKLSDIDMQHTIPGISVMYNWMVIPFLIGLYWLFYQARERNVRLLLLLFFTSLIPSVLSGEFISIQRSLPFLLPLTIVVGLGIDRIVSRLNTGFNIILFVFLFIYSLLMLYRSYFVLFPIERAEAWNYGYSQVADYIKKSPEAHFLIDNSRNPRNYVLLLYYLRYPPRNYQMEVDAKYKVDYYKSLPSENSYKFSNIEVRTINWEGDSYKDQIIIGDALSISDSQAKDHYLEKIYDIYNPMHNVIFVFYKTNPGQKCKSSPNNLLCK
jgi:4-amino-4-deoxy-L-arabinose transferase-like glycosyltransferase